MEFEVKESKALEDGRHEGVITRVDYRTEPYKYTDVYIKESKTGYELKYGCPSDVSEKTKLGKLLFRFSPLTLGEMVNPETILVGKAVVFMSIQEENKQGNFTRVVDGSVKPLEKPEDKKL